MKKILAALAIAGATALGMTAMAGTAQAATCGAGDPPITTSRHTSCQLAGNAVNEYANYSDCARNYTAWVYSPRTHKGYTLRFARRGYTITVTGPRGIWARFSSMPFC